MTKLFISYAHTDSEVVTQISEVLRGAGHDVWVDTRGIQGGSLWGSEIAQAITNCEVLVLFISSKSMASDFVRREVDIAFDGKKKILPVRLENVEIPVQLDYQLAGIQYIDYRAADWKSRLLAALGSQPTLRAVKAKVKPKNPYSSLPVLEPIERTLILSNREKELKKAIHYLDQHRLLLITGMPGIGKSTFARALLEFMPPGSPPPFWYNFERQRSSGNSLSVLLDRISSYLDVCLNMDVQREVMAFRSSEDRNASVNDVDVLISFLNQEIPIWLVFDNLETVLSRDTRGFLDESVELLFDSLKNNTENTKIIITNPFVPVLKDGEEFLEAGTWTMTLGGLDNASAVAFLRAYGLDDLSEDKLEPLVREINGHPFVLNHIAHYIQTMGISAALENLQGDLEEVHGQFADSLKERLSSQEFNALQSLTILNREMRLNGLCQVAQVKPSIIMRLREKGLLQTNDAGYFWMHNIVRNSIKPTELNVIKQAHLRAMDFYRRQDLPTAHQGIDDYANVLEWQHHAVEAGDVLSAYTALYSTGLADQLMSWNEYDLLSSLCEQTLSSVYRVEANLEQVQANLSNIERIKIYHTLGITCFLLGDFSKSIAHLKSALNLLQSEEDNELRIRLLIDLSESYNGNRDFKSAMDLCQQIVTLLTTINDDALQAKFLHLRGIINRDEGDLELAENDLEEALKIYEKLNDQTHFANAMLDLGIVYYSQNKFVEAIAIYGRVVILSESMHDMRGVMIAHFNIGDINLQDGQYESALKEFELALEIARKKKIGWMEAYAGLYFVETQIALKDFDGAERVLPVLKSIISKQASPCLSGHELVLIASLDWKSGKYEMAKKSFTRAFEYFEKADCQEQRGRAYITFAGFMKEQGHLASAKDALKRGEEIFHVLNNQLGLKAVERAGLDIQNDNRTL